MSKEIKYLKRNVAIAHIGLQSRVFDKLVRNGKIQRLNHRGMECYDKAELDEVRRGIDHPPEEKVSWLQGIWNAVARARSS